MPSAPEETPRFCLAPWTALFIQNDGAVSPCCHYGRHGSIGNLNDASPEEIWNSPEAKRLRLEMLAGKSEIPDCRDCRRTERAGERSLRHEFARMHRDQLGRAAKTRVDGGVETFEPVSLSVSTGDRCQLRCQTCGPFSSSAWKKELDIPADADSLKPVARERIRVLVARSRSLRQILFHGGEPLISPLHYGILDLLLDQGRQDITEIFYNTNLYQLRWASKDAPEYWNRFANVTLYVSIDGVGERFEALRRGHRWPRMLRNLAEVRGRCPHVAQYAFLTVSAYNFLDVPHTVRTLLDEGLFPVDRILFNYVRVPADANAQTAPAERRQEAKRKYLAFMKELLVSYDADVAAHLVALFRVAIKYLESEVPAEPSLPRHVARI